jgi:hypothetical protein
LELSLKHFLLETSSHQLTLLASCLSLILSRFLLNLSTELGLLGSNFSLFTCITLSGSCLICKS